MSREEIINIIHKHYRKLNKCVKNIRKHFKPGDIHKFRVEYKKLRAFLRMLSLGKNAADKLKIAKKIKNGYQVLGSIRDVQLQIGYISSITKDDIKKPKAYLKFLKQEIKKLKPEFSQLSLKKAFKKSEQKNLELLVDEFAQSDFKKFAENNWAAIVAIVDHKEFADSKIHGIRKLLKDIFYNMQVSEKLNIKKAAPAEENAEPSQQYFDQLLEDLGTFHDRLTSIELLEPEWISCLDSRDQKLMTRIKNKVIQEKNTLKSALEKILINDVVSNNSRFYNSVFR